MSQIAMPTPQRPSNLKFTSRRPTATAAAANSRSSLSDDEITPCSSPAPEPQEPLVSSSPQHRASPSSSSSSRKTTATTTNTSQWHFDPADGEDMDDSQLWQRMLDIQRTFHCYNSARMSAALLELEMGVDVWRLARMFPFLFPSPPPPPPPRLLRVLLYRDETER